MIQYAGPAAGPARAQVTCCTHMMWQAFDSIVRECPPRSFNERPNADGCNNSKMFTDVRMHVNVGGTATEKNLN